MCWLSKKVMGAFDFRLRFRYITTDGGAWMEMGFFMSASAASAALLQRRPHSRRGL